MDKVQETSSFNYSLPVSEPIRIDLCKWYGCSIYPSFRKLEQLNIHLNHESYYHITFLMRCKSQDIIPKGLSLKAPHNSHRSSKIVQRASKALVRDRMQLHQYERLPKSIKYSRWIIFSWHQGVLSKSASPPLWKAHKQTHFTNRK
jgi:hypothetical protein